MDAPFRRRRCCTGRRGGSLLRFREPRSAGCSRKTERSWPRRVAVRFMTTELARLGIQLAQFKASFPVAQALGSKTRRPAI